MGLKTYSLCGSTGSDDVIMLCEGKDSYHRMQTLNNTALLSELKDTDFVCRLNMMVTHRHFPWSHTDLMSNPTDYSFFVLTSICLTSVTVSLG